MSNIGGGEIFAVLLLALIVLGPERLPEAARKIGGFVRQVRAMSTGFQDEVRKAIDLGDTPFHPEEARIKALPEAEPQPAADLEADIRGRNDADAAESAPRPVADAGHDGAGGADAHAGDLAPQDADTPVDDQAAAG